MVDLIAIIIVSFFVGAFAFSEKFRKFLGF